MSDTRTNAVLQDVNGHQVGLLPGMAAFSPSGGGGPTLGGNNIWTGTNTFQDGISVTGGVTVDTITSTGAATFDAGVSVTGGMTTDNFTGTGNFTWTGGTLALNGAGINNIGQVSGHTGISGNGPIQGGNNTTALSTLRFGTGAPSGLQGSIGDFYFRQDGSTATHLYFKSGASTWTALI